LGKAIGVGGTILVSDIEGVSRRGVQKEGENSSLSVFALAVSWLGDTRGM
jgi:hypothetical protein